MSWDGWRERLNGDDVAESAIVGFQAGAESVWTSSPGLAGVTVAEIKMMVSSDRSPLFAGKQTVVGVPCTLLRDNLLNDPNTMDLKTKATDNEPDKFCISVAMTKTTLLICKGKKDTHGGKLNQRVYELAVKLKEAGF